MVGEARAEREGKGMRKELSVEEEEEEGKEGGEGGEEKPVRQVRDPIYRTM